MFLFLFFTFNTLEIDSNSDKILLYDKDNIFVEDSFKVYFNNMNSNRLFEILEALDIKVLSYIIDGEKYYARNKYELEELYLKDKELNDKIYYENSGFNIDGINIKCIVNELIKLENLSNIY